MVKYRAKIFLNKEFFLPNTGIELRSPTLPENSLLYEPLQTQKILFWFISTYVPLSSSLRIKKKIFFLLLIEFKDFPVWQQSTSSSVYYVLILFNLLLFMGMILVLLAIFSGPQKR